MVVSGNLKCLLGGFQLVHEFGLARGEDLFQLGRVSAFFLVEVHRQSLIEGDAVGAGAGAARR